MYEGNFQELYVDDKLRELSPETVLRFCIGVASAAAEMHALGVVHRDLKTSKSDMCNHSQLSHRKEAERVT